MLEEKECPICEGTKKLKAQRQVGLKKEEYETECWACKGSGTIWFKPDTKPKYLKTIVPGDEDEEKA